MGAMAHRKGDGRTAHQCFNKAAFIDPLNQQALTNIDRIEETMSGQELQRTEEDTVSISVRPTTAFVESISLSDLNTTINNILTATAIGVAIAL